MVLVHVKYGEASMAPAVFNPDCDSATLLDYVRRRAVKDTEASPYFTWTSTMPV